MKISDSVLGILMESPVPVSGEEIAGRLGVSRNSIWKAVGKLREEGYDISAGTNKGYCLVSEGNVLTCANIRRHLSPEAGEVAIDIRDSVSSTNTVLKEIGEKGGKEGMVLIAHQQSAGKGRLGRSFQSPKGNGLYMSILLRPKFSPEGSLSITTAAAVAVAQAVDRITDKFGKSRTPESKAKIKWVNDVYLRGKKICGILTEASVDFENRGLHYAVLGIGVNLEEPEGGYSHEVKQVAGAVFEKAPPGARAMLAAEILNYFFSYYRTLPHRDFMTQYRERSLLTGMDITFTSGNEAGEGTVLGVDDEARLLVRLPDGRAAAFSSGEVNIKKSFMNQIKEGE